MQRSTDLGKTWERSEQLAMPEGHDPLKRMWHVEPSHATEPETLWAGGDPGVVFKSTGGGDTWVANRAILEHPKRNRWQPGAGGLCCHSIQLDPTDANRLYIAISAAGAFRTDDGGESWTPVNKSVAADFLGGRRRSRGRPLRAQAAASSGEPGAALAAESLRCLPLGRSRRHLGAPGPRRPSVRLRLPDRARAVGPGRGLCDPEEGAENRVTSNGRLGVYRTADSLPEQAWVAVLCEAMAYDDGGVYFGAQSGLVFALRPLVNPFVDRTLERDLATPLRDDSEIRVVAAIAGG